VRCGWSWSTRTSTSHSGRRLSIAEKSTADQLSLGAITASCRTLSGHRGLLGGGGRPAKLTGPHGKPWPGGRARYASRPAPLKVAWRVLGPRTSGRHSHLDHHRGSFRPPFLSHFNDDLAFCSSCLDVNQSLFGRCEWKDPIHHWADDPRIDERSDLAQLVSACSHEKE
jgi:hypothetical protein